MHGIGNDYVYVNGFTETVGDPPAVARVISHRHFGVGSDGLILILPSDRADVRMRMFNADGSEAEMCGNGIRCVAKYAFDHGLTKNNPMMVETGRGVLPLELELGADGKVRRVTVNMGEPILSLAEIPESQRGDNPKGARIRDRHQFNPTRSLSAGGPVAGTCSQDPTFSHIAPATLANQTGGLASRSRAIPPSPGPFAAH